MADETPDISTEETEADVTEEMAEAAEAVEAILRDGLDAAIDAGVTAVIQPGGAMRDDEVIAAADGAGMAMVLTGERHFRH